MAISMAISMAVKSLNTMHHDSMSVNFVRFGQTSPLPHNATWGNTQILTTKNELLTEFSYKGSCISTVFCVDIQHVSPCCHDPLGSYWDEAEDKSLYATCYLEPESLGVKLANDGLIEIVYQCRKQKKDRVLCHERLWEPVPVERFFKRAQRTNLFGLCRAQETKVALLIRCSYHRIYVPCHHVCCKIWRCLL